MVRLPASHLCNGAPAHGCMPEGPASLSMKRSTVTDVAKLAGVGTSSVSRFLRGISVRPEAHERIAAAVEQLGYTPDETARALRGGRTRTIGLAIPHVASAFFSNVLQLMEQEVRRRGSAIILITHGDDRQQQLRHFATLTRYRVDGLLLAAAPHSTPSEIRKALPHVPIVLFDRVISPEFDTIALRNREAGRAATEHLLQHRYKSIACVTIRSEVSPFNERFAGYAEAMQEARRPTQLIEAPDHDQLRLSLSAALTSRNRPAALLSFTNRATGSILSAYNDLVQTGADRLPFIGFDDFEFASLIDPPVTTMRQPIELMVRYALELLFRRIEDTETRKQRPSMAEEESSSTDAAQMITLPAEFVCRNSCGCK